MTLPLDVKTFEIEQKMISKQDKQHKILIVDDELAVRHLLAEILSEAYECEIAASAEEALEKVGTGRFSVVISDIDMPGISGIEMVPQVLEKSPNTVILMISGNLSVDYAVQAIRVGAYDYITKPFELDIVELAVQRAVAHHKLLVEKKQYEADLEELVKQRTEEIKFLIYHDSLTNLPNRLLFEDRLSGEVLKARKGGRLAVLCLSIDNFDKMQSHIGHSRADELLRVMAKRFVDTAGPDVSISRLHESHFGLLTTRHVEQEDLLDLSARLLEQARIPVKCGDTEVFLTASVGISVFPEDGVSPEELMKNAGNALGRARECGGDCVEFYSHGIKMAIASRLKLEADFRRGLERDEFEVYYQPKVSVAGGEILGVEALVRWNHPEDGMVSPAEFIPLAESTGLIVPLGETVLRKACQQGAEWCREGFEIEVAVNVSARQLKQSDLAQRFLAVIKESGIKPEKLNLEVTESSLMDDAEASAALLERFRQNGIRISLDDFGTGYSSLAYLKKLPIDQLKIDKEFISDIAPTNEDTVLLNAMVNLAHNLRLKVVAEGVETAEQLGLLRSMRCDQYQGFHFSKPVDAQEIGKMLRVQRKVQFAQSSDDLLSIMPHGFPVAAAA